MLIAKWEDVKSLVKQVFNNIKELLSDKADKSDVETLSTKKADKTEITEVRDFVNQDFIKKAGDKMTGNLEIIKSPESRITFNVTDNTNFRIGAIEDSNSRSRFFIYNTKLGASAMTIFAEDNTIGLNKPLSISSGGTGMAGTVNFAGTPNSTYASGTNKTLSVRTWGPIGLLTVYFTGISIPSSNTSVDLGTLPTDACPAGLTFAIIGGMNGSSRCPVQISVNQNGAIQVLNNMNNLNITGLFGYVIFYLKSAFSSDPGWSEGPWFEGMEALGEFPIDTLLPEQSYQTELSSSSDSTLNNSSIAESSENTGGTTELESDIPS